MNPDTIQKIRKSDNSDNVFSILLPTWNNLSYLKLCVDSLRKNSTHQHQIIVLVNEGKDGSLEWIQRQTDIDYVYAPANLGICYGLNACRSLVATDYILYLNDDMYVLPGWDDLLKKEADQIGHSSFIISSTMIEPTDIGSPCIMVQDFGDTPENFREKELLQHYKELPMHDWTGSTWPPVLIPVVLWDLVGGMSVEFSPGMYSDPDLSMKLWQAGVRYFKGLGASRVYHFGSKSTKRIKKNKGRDRFLQKYGITSRTFTKYYLKRGTPFTGPLPEKQYISPGKRLLNKLKLLHLLITDRISM